MSNNVTRPLYSAQVPVIDDRYTCDGPDCPYQWFHFQCVGLSKEPPGEWYCGDCKYTNSSNFICNYSVSFMSKSNLNCY